MKPSVRALAGACTSLAMGLPALAWSQAPYPSQPIRVIVPYAPVGTSDIVARAMSDRVRERLGQPFVIVSADTGCTVMPGAEPIVTVITLVVFALFSTLYLREEFKWNYLVGFVLIFAAVFVVFHKW